MSLTLTAQKRLVTLYVNKLTHMVSKLKGEKLHECPMDDTVVGPILNDMIVRLQESLSAITFASSKVEALWKELASSLDSDHKVDVESTDYADYADKAESALADALELVVLLQARLQALMTKTQAPSNQSIVPQNTVNDTLQEMNHPRPRSLELPPLPIPTFGGNLWEWDNFWELFSTNIHSQDLPEMVKFNYLLNALKGRAKESIRKFQVTRGNYNKAIDFLLARYNNKELLVNNLVEQLDACALKSHSIKDQRTLLEEIQVIMAQLQEKGENVSSAWLLKKVLTKFPDSVKRRVITRKQELPAGSALTMPKLFQYLEEILSTDEMCILFSGKSPGHQHSQAVIEKPVSLPVKHCMYCKEGHSSRDCYRYPTAQERSQYLRNNKLCLICASPAHNTGSCKGKPCFQCKGAHHTSCCFKGSPKATLPNKAGSAGKQPTSQNPGRFNRTSNRGIKGILPAQSHVVTTADNSQTEPANLHYNSVEPRYNNPRAGLPTGYITVMDHQTRALLKVDVLLDTGAEISFIDASLAEKLNLPVLEETSICINTFGAKEHKQCQSKRVRLDAWDSEGTPYSLEILTHDGLTRPLMSTKLPIEDMEFVKSLNLPIIFNNEDQFIQPLILLGCDHLWTFVRCDIPSIELPSGLHILPTKIGYLVSGKSQPQNHKVHQIQVAQEQLPHNNAQLWDRYWSMDSFDAVSIGTVSEEITVDEREKWDQYWAIEAAGTDQFGGSEAETKLEVDRKVWQQFSDTIERRADGYYVRLPWKDHYPQLPDNKALAYQRLVHVYTSLSRNEQLLREYNNVFQEQLEQRIIEIVPDEESTEGRQIHYIPHQPVLTPHKTTTKLRVVFDASSHYRGCPSLNDVLHRGPVILPLLYGILLRFRIGETAIISDIEKAFLQVRLQEQDRDATRCLWVRNYQLRPSQSNIITYRFTRVTFGLKSSPFLLAGTTHYHLNTYETEQSLVNEIKSNMYVDNLILTADTTEEGIHYYQRTKQMFRDLNMNLREFATNDLELMQYIKNIDRTVQPIPKVLGIPWDFKEDLIIITCQFPDTPLVTKRTITSAIATIYDPLGWILPLLHKTKCFLQNVWREQYDWDTALPKEKEEEWSNIVREVQGFSKRIPRFLAPKESEVVLLTFADASSTAITACTYLHYDDRAQLLMAKAKLPSLHAKFTIPKLELNAVTLAMRVTNSIVTQLEGTVRINKTYLFSDSEIVLTWLKKNPGRDAGPFIVNRMTEIKKICNHLNNKNVLVRFGYVPSEANPADCGTRGLTKDELLNHIWWNGPPVINTSSLKEIEKNTFMAWDDDKGEVLQREVPTGVVTTTLRTSIPPITLDLIDADQAKTFTQAKRIIAYVLRFVHALIYKLNTHRSSRLELSVIKQQEPQYSEFLSVVEIQLAGRVLIKNHQKSRITPSTLHALKDLNIHPDDDGILRCYGRLGHAQLTFDAKYPIFVLQKTPLAYMIIRDFHRFYHPGTNHTMSLIRQEYWIPHLRSQVQKVIRKCLRCQKFNNLPYKYPTQESLPQERVVRSAPFKHVGLDYFGPLSLTNRQGEPGNQNKCYGAIITCMVTRMLHLDVVVDLSTTSFLNMLRRFFARRGIPRSITSDNAPTFLLGESILNDCIEAAQKDPTINSEITIYGIEWKHITPYAPWQGGFYERLIKSVKHSLYKTLGNSLVSIDTLTTILVEIEGMLNTRPLTYIATDFDNIEVLRPIDFLQKEMVLSHAWAPPIENKDDPDYVPPEEIGAIQTRQQAIAALESSYKMTEKFWHLWQTQYLTHLREKHTLEVKTKKGCTQTPREGTLVLICEAILPRYDWKMGIIQELVRNAEGTVREAVVRLPSRRRIRRPINLLVPLELDDENSKTPSNPTNQSENQASPGTSTPASSSESVADSAKKQHSYDFRSRKPINYSDDQYDQEVQPNFNKFAVSNVIQLLLLLCMVGVNASDSSITSQYNIRCIEGGVQLAIANTEPYELCADYYCVEFQTPGKEETITFPPQVILHEHKVQWKLLENQTIKAIETLCPSALFCKFVTCTFCSANITNPECWPMRAIFALAVIIYLLFTGCYVFLYVPIVIGRPFTILATIIWHIVTFAFRKIRYLGKPKKFRHRPLAEILAITTLLVSHSQGCQIVDLFEHYSTVCIKNSNKPCQMHLSEVFKINTFKQEACLRLSLNNTPVQKLHLRWKSLVLRCEPETDLFTRDTTYMVIDSKRCAGRGSCIKEKCGAINSSSLLPELQEGNRYPGNTACVESCGGLGCDCFFPSSGCLFYRTYLKPRSYHVFEIFHCNRWIGAAKIEISHFEGARSEPSTAVLELTPNIPTQWKSFSITLSSLALPPTPLFNTYFISDSIRTALWEREYKVALRCADFISAKKLNCKALDNCKCTPAENHVNCRCTEFSIANWFNNTRHQLPIVFPSITFFPHRKSKVQARVSSMVTAEIVTTFQAAYKPQILIDDAVCTIEDADLKGCYGCAKGAFTSITCKASRDHVQAEIICNQWGFTVPCNTSGITSTLRFTFTTARNSITCSVSCGKLSRTFTIEGILKFVITPGEMLTSWLRGKTEDKNNFTWPDFFHIFTVFSQWYKTVLVAIIGLLTFGVLTYVFLSTCGHQESNMSTDYSSEMLFLTNLQLDSISAELLESDLTNSLEEIHSQVKATKILQVAWQHHIDEKIVDEAPAGEQVLLINRFLRTASITREAMLRWTQRFLMIDAIFQMRTDSGHVPARRRKQWLENGTDHDTHAEDLIPIANDNLKRLDQYVEAIEKELNKAEKRLQEEKRWLTGLVSLAKVTGGAEEHPEADAELTDDQYMDRLIDESSGGNEEMDTRESASTHTDKLHEVQGGSGQQAETDRLEKILKELEYAQCRLPRRRIGDVSDDKTSDVRCTFCSSLEHFSDSCPRITDGDERYRFVKRRNLCPHCLEDCDPSRPCLKKGKSCFYCEVIRKTKYLHFLIPKDPGHHRALCNIPNSKNIIAERIQELKHEIERVRRST